MIYEHDLLTLSNIDYYELDNGDWCLDYTGPGGDYRVIFAGPDAEIRVQRARDFSLSAIRGIPSYAPTYGRV